MYVVENVADLIDKTPMTRLAPKGIEANLSAKLEHLNPCGILKDRIEKPSQVASRQTQTTFLIFVY